MTTKRDNVATDLLWWILAALLLLASAGIAAWVRSLETQVGETKADVRAQESKMGETRERMMRVETKVENVQKSVDDQKTDLGEIKGMLRVQQQPGGTKR